MNLIEQLKGTLVVSCQAEEGFPLNTPEHLLAMAQSAALGGAAAIRASGPQNTSAMRAALDLPIIGIYKNDYPAYSVRITPTLAEVEAVVAAGADIIALDATSRPRPSGQTLIQIVQTIQERYRALIMADISTLEEGIFVAALGVDFISTILSGYTDYKPDIALVHALTKQTKTPIIAEGRIATPHDVAAAYAAGAHAVVVGSMITRPHKITRFFRSGLPRPADAPPIPVLDIGGTKISAGLVDPDGSVSQVNCRPTPTHDPNAIAAVCSEMLMQVQAHSQAAANVVGIASAGQVNQYGEIIGSTDHIRNWTHFSLKQQLTDALGLPVAIINDGHAAALGEAFYGAARGKASALCIVIGTGLGGGLVINGQLQHGSFGLAGSLGQLKVTQDGEQYVSLETLVSGIGLVHLYQQQPHAQADIQQGEQIAALAVESDMTASAAISKMGELLGLGLSHILHGYDAEIVLLAGSVTQLGDKLLKPTRTSLARHGYGTVGRTTIELAQLNEHANLIGAAVFADQSFSIAR